MDNLTSDNSSSSSVSEMSCLTSQYCLPLAITLILTASCGIVANVLVVVLVAFERQLKKPTYVAIASLALSDGTFLVARLSRYVLGGYARHVHEHESRTIKLVFDFLGLAAAGSSIVHILLLSLMRYYMVVHPIRCQVWLTCKKVVIVSTVVWLLCTANGAFYLYAVIINRHNDIILAKYTNFVVTIVMSVLPIVLIATLHLLKARKLRYSLAICKTKMVQRMSRVVTVVIVAFLITTMPSNIKDILEIAHSHNTEEWFQIFGSVGRIMLFLNYAINPFIYFVLSPQFTRAIRKCCGLKSSNKKYTLASSKNSTSKTRTTVVD